MKKIYGIIEEDGYLNARELEPTLIHEKTGDRTTAREVSIEEQAAMLPHGWKRVKDIDESQLAQEDETHIIILQPYDAGDCIDYHYIRKFDMQKVKNEIKNLKEELASSDYKVIKCQESNLAGDTLPYDIQNLHEQRNTLRERINALETSILEPK